MSTVRVAPDMTFVTLIHQALRADGARLQATAAALQPQDRQGRVADVHAFYDRYREQLIAHHTHEDHLFFPALVAKVGGDTMHFDELTAQHAELDGVLEAIEQSLDDLADPNR